MLPLEPAHFARWRQLFGQTVDELFADETATKMKLRAGKMGKMFQAKIAMARTGGHAIL